MSSAPEIFPSPVFEGSEKRISISFGPAAHSNPVYGGLRALSRAQLDSILDLAACQIVSARHNDHFDAYVLSESSLFVYPTRFVLKTCGTTKLLDAVPLAVELASALGLMPTYVKYSRASFLFPENQPAPYNSFDHECHVLQGLFSGLGSSAAYVLGDKLNGSSLQWHVYVAGTGPKGPSASRAIANSDNQYLDEPLHTLEVCMTNLSTKKASQFFRGTDFVSAQCTTEMSGIRGLVPAHDIDDYVFEPCGYSMNGMAHKEFSTVHITPEEGFSYASFELCGHNPAAIRVEDLLSKCAIAFGPRSISVAVTIERATSMQNALQHLGFMLAPPGYEVHSASQQQMLSSLGVGYVAYYTFVAGEDAIQCDAQPLTTRMESELAGALYEKLSVPTMSGSECSDSPRGVLKNHGVFSSTCFREDDGTTGKTCYSEDAGSSQALTTTVMDADTEYDNRGIVEGKLPLAFDDVLTTYDATCLPYSDAATLNSHIHALIQRHNMDDNFYIVDLGAVRRLWQAWVEALPRVHAHYAVKCNNDPALLAVLAAMGAGFDCASLAEIDLVLSLGVNPDRIVFANPCKRHSDIKAAMSKGVYLSTFDTEAELLKLKEYCCSKGYKGSDEASLRKSPRVLLRIRADDPTARCPLGNKFGAEEEEWETLFIAAQKYGVNVEGISFHVGSGATNPAAFSYAIEQARRAFDLGACYGFVMTILDVGGGFCAKRVSPAASAIEEVDLGGVPAAINTALAEHFPEGSGIRVIAEPGRYFAESAATLATLVYGRRVRPQTVASQGGASEGHGSAYQSTHQSHAMQNEYEYWITDGLYGSMNCLLYDHATVKPRALLASAGQHLLPSTLFGPTCDGLDTVVRSYPLPELQVGDWVVFPDMGAYTLCGASKFNGINAVDVPTFYVCSARP